MLKSKLFLCLILLTSLAVAQKPDSLYRAQQNAISALEKKAQNTEQQNAAFDAQLKEMKTQVAALATENGILYEEVRQNQQSIDSLSKMVARNSENIQTTADSLGIKIRTTDEAVAQNSDNLKSKTKWGISAIILALLASFVIGFLYKKGQKTTNDKITSLKQQADELNEKIVNQFSTEIVELQKISDSINTQSVSNAEPDHSLVKTLADRICFMEMTLYRMDKSVKGHKALSKAIAQMKDNLLANGYEIVDMLGKEYDDGMRINASFIEDENIEQGKQIISAITKPQINYKGEIIQKAQVTVSQNI